MEGVVGKALQGSLLGLPPAWVTSRPLGKILKGLRLSILSFPKHGSQRGEEGSMQEKFWLHFLSKQGIKGQQSFLLHSLCDNVIMSDAQALGGASETAFLSPPVPVGLKLPRI